MLSGSIQAAHYALSQTAFEQRLRHARCDVRVSQWQRDAFHGAAVGTLLNAPVRALLGTGSCDFFDTTRPRTIERGLVNHGVALAQFGIERALGGFVAVSGGLVGCLIGIPKETAKTGFKLGTMLTSWVLQYPAFVIADLLGIVSLPTQALACAIGAAVGVAVGFCLRDRPLEERLGALMTRIDEMYAEAEGLGKLQTSREGLVSHLARAKVKLASMSEEVAAVEIESARRHALSPELFLEQAELALDRLRPSRVDTSPA